MDTLFDEVAERQAPLAERMRPRTIDEVVGQAHVLGPGRPLAAQIRGGDVGSIILTGPPGTGKTTLARLIGHHGGRAVATMNAVTDGVAQLREVVAAAQKRASGEGRGTVLFIDEVHRWSKAQQDALLPHVERGTVSLVAATTENPSFRLTGALLSRSRVVQLRPLDTADLVVLAERALTDRERGLGHLELVTDAETLQWLAAAVDGDARRLYGALESAAREAGLRGEVTRELLATALSMRVVAYDIDGIGPFDMLSALHKSVRGSDPQAALYWMARMIRAGEDPEVIARRLVTIASEDVGVADPQALPVAMAAWDAYRRLGPAEGHRAIAHAAVHLATAPKSNSVYTAWNAAQEAAERTARLPVPAHLLNSDMAVRHDASRRVSYRYPFDEPEAFVVQDYLPEPIRDEVFYTPGPFGAERRIGERMGWWAQLRERVRGTGKKG